MKHLRELTEVGSEDVVICGGKSASLGEMLRKLSRAGIRVPGGFTTLASFFGLYMAHNGIWDRVFDRLKGVDVHNERELSEAGQEIRSTILAGTFSAEMREMVREYLAVLVAEGATSLAVRSSATAEDLPDASFAGQQDTILNVPTDLDSVLDAMKRVFASMFSDRAIFYRVVNGYDHSKVSICAVVQKMVRSDLSVAGVMFTADSETGHGGVIGITAVWGLGELAVGGYNADECAIGKPTKDGGPFAILQRRHGKMLEKLVFSSDSSSGRYTELCETTDGERNSFCLSYEDLQELGAIAMIIENHYGCPMDVEFAKDGLDGKIYVVQARPLTVNKDVKARIETYHITGERTKVLLEGVAVGRRIGTGRVKILADSSPKSLGKIEVGDVLVARMTDPNYVSAMKRASAIITVEGSTKCHAAIVAREIGIPAVVACENALEVLSDGDVVTVSCAEGKTGHVFEGQLSWSVDTVELGDMPDVGVEIKMNVGEPDIALDCSMLPNDGVGLARQELIILNGIGIHPLACLNYDSMPDEVKRQIDARTIGYKDPVDFYIKKLAEGIGMIARAFYPNRVILRLSDFKTNEYRGLIGGEFFEPVEANPMIGYRGAARYLDPKFVGAFALECRAIKMVLESGLDNVDLMVPFVRTVREGERVVKLLSEMGLSSSASEGGMQIGMMCEVPSNVVMARQFLADFDFMSIGTNDLTQLTLGADRDSGCNYGDETDPSVKWMIKEVVRACKQAGKPIGICGQAPSDHEGYAEWLASEVGINSISLNPDTVASVWQRIARMQQVVGVL